MINLITENKLTLKGVNQMVAHVEEHEKFEFVNQIFEKTVNR